jgi:hypothetical protein
MMKYGFNQMSDWKYILKRHYFFKYLNFIFSMKNRIQLIKTIIENNLTINLAIN